MDDRPSRRPLRLPEYDYSTAGGYFITVCTRDKAQILCRGAHCAPAEGGRFPLSEKGMWVRRGIENIPKQYPGITVEKYVIMPNHVHLILMIHTDGGRTMCAPTVSRVVRGLKEYVTKRCGVPVWQRSYYDRVLRGEEDFLRAWGYLDGNPARWAEDEYCPAPGGAESRRGPVRTTNIRK